MRLVLLLAALVIAGAIVLAPAALLRHVIPSELPLQLIQPSGTLWHGGATLGIGGRDAGNLTWEIDPVTILQGTLGYHLRLAGPEHDLGALISLTTDQITVALDGRAEAAWLNRWLGDYDISLSGNLVFEEITATLPWHFERGDSPDVLAAGSTAGRLRWSGGPVRYRLSGRNNGGTLPPLVAVLGPGPEAVAGTVPDAAGRADAPAIVLLRASVLGNGFAKVEMSRLMTGLAGNPWPGNGAPEEIVITVEEQLL